MRDNVMQDGKSNNALQTKEKQICGAKTRQGHPCKTHPVTGRKRCRMHGGTNNGAPKGNKNALKHGYYSKEKILARAEVHKHIREYRRLRKEIDAIEGT